MPQPRTDAPAAGSDRHEQARAWAEHWSQAWFLDANGNDRLRFDAIDAGWATHAESYYLLHAFALDRFGLPRPAPSLPDRLKARGYDRALRAAAAHLSKQRERGRRTAEVACILEIPTPSMTDGVLAVARALGANATVLAADPRAARRARAVGVAATILRVPPATQLRLLRHASRTLRAKLSELRDGPPFMPLDGQDVGAAAVRALEPLVRNSAPWLLAEREALVSAFDLIRPRSTILASDQHRIGRLACTVAASREIRTIVVQHGLPQQRIGLLPVVADVVATWSEASRDWFLEHGTASDRLLITGNPRWSPPRHRAAAGMVLVALSPAPVHVNRRVVQMALGAVHALGPGATLVVKLHPGHRSWDWVRDTVRGTPARVALHEPIEPMIAEAEATVVLRSTVAMDALAAGCPVVLVRVPDGTSAADAELNGAGLPVAESTQTLTDAIRAVSGERGRSEYFAQRSSSIARLLGPNDAVPRLVALAMEGAED